MRGTGCGAAAGVGALLLGMSLWAGAGVAAPPDSSSPAMQALGLARHYYETGDFDKAASLFHDAYRLDPHPEFLYNAARAEQRGLKLEAARTHFEQLLAIKGLDESLAKKARLRLAEVVSVKGALTKAKEEGREEAKGGLPKPPPLNENDASAAGVGAKAAHGRDGTLGWAALGVGGAALVAGGVVFALGYLDGEDLDDKYKGGEPITADRDEVLAEYDAVSLKETAGIGTASVGLVGLALGAWWLSGSSPSPRVALASSAGLRRVTLTWRF